MGMAVGSLPALTGLLVDQARLWAEPQATRLIFLPVKIEYHTMKKLRRDCNVCKC